MVSLKINFETRETILQSFDEIADEFSKNLLFKINDAYYRLLDFEFYAYSKELPDPHTYPNDLRLQNGKLCSHEWGIDLTFGDLTNRCGMLLRSIVKMNEDLGKDYGY